MNHYDYIRKNIYERAGMLNSDSYDIDGPVKILPLVTLQSILPIKKKLMMSGPILTSDFRQKALQPGVHIHY